MSSLSVLTSGCVEDAALWRGLSELDARDGKVRVGEAQVCVLVLPPFIQYASVVALPLIIPPHTQVSSWTSAALRVSASRTEDCDERVAGEQFESAVARHLAVGREFVACTAA